MEMAILMNIQALGCYSSGRGCGKGRGGRGIHISVILGFESFRKSCLRSVGESVQLLEIGGKFGSILSSVVFHNFKCKTLYLQNKKTV